MLKMFLENRLSFPLPVVRNSLHDTGSIFDYWVFWWNQTFRCFFFSFYGFLLTYVKAARLHNFTKTVTINGIYRKINDSVWTDGWYQWCISDHVNTCGTMLQFLWGDLTVFLPQVVSLLMIGVAAWGKWFGLVTSIRVVAGVISVGVFLFLVALVGLCGALKHQQVLLFFVSFDVCVCGGTGSRLTSLSRLFFCWWGLTSRSLENSQPVW